MVLGPVAIARAVAVPLTTDVPRNTRCGASGPDALPSVDAWACLSAGNDSPVSIDCWTERSRDSSKLASAGTRSPAESRKTSPGTTLRRGISIHAPSRWTVAVGTTDERRRSAACCER